VDEFSNFSTFSVVLLVLGRPERSSSSTDTRPAMKRECQSKPLSGLKNVLEILTKHFNGFDIGFTEIQAKLDADMLLDFTIHRRQNETRSRKALV
jgi:hypothetical protein